MYPRDKLTGALFETTLKTAESEGVPNVDRLHETTGFRVPTVRQVRCLHGRTRIYM